MKEQEISGYYRYYVFKGDDATKKIRKGWILNG
jgi:hypothetical protein